MKPYLLWTSLWIFSFTQPISANVTQTPKRHPVFLPKSTNFEEITDCYAFVDKTLFIETFFNYKSSNYHIFTRPRKFGKSTNIDMLKRFVQIEVDQAGRVKKKNETTSYRLFTNRTLQISNYEDIINGYLGKYPVIHIEFKGIMKDTFDETLKNIRDRVRKSCQPYEWMIEILQNRYLSANDTNIAQQVRFLKKAIYGTMNLDITMKSLSLLAKVLVNYFHRELFVFIDDYDEPIDYGLRYAHRVKYDATKIRSVMSTMMGKLFDRRMLGHIKYIMITGLALGSPSMFDSFGIELQHHRFLSGLVMSTFFGFTEEEVARVMVKRRIDITQRHKIIEYYNGFFNRAGKIRIYNTNGVLNYLGSFKKRNITYPFHWIDPGSLDFMQETLKNPKVYLFWLEILLDKGSKFAMKTYAEEIRILKLSSKLKNHIRPKITDIEALMWYFKENGYIVSGGSSHLQILPNKETQVEFTKVLFQYYDSKVSNISAPVTDTFKNLAEFVNIDDEVPNLKRRLETLIRSEFKFDSCKELHYFGLIYYSVASHFKDVFVDIKVLSQDTAYYIVVCEKEAVIVIAVKYERGIKKALRQAFNYHTDNKLTKGKNIRFIGIKINLPTEIVSIAYFSPYNRISVSFAVESEERESGLYDMFQVF